MDTHDRLLQALNLATQLGVPFTILAFRARAETLRRRVVRWLPALLPFPLTHTI